MLVLVFSIVVALAIVLGVRGDRRCRDQIQRWAMGNGLQVEVVRRRWFWFGPFWWRTSRSQRVYDIVAADTSGKRHQFIARVGGWLGGALVEHIDVERR